MENSDTILQKIVVIAIAAMMLGVFSPYLFPDRVRVVNVNVFVPTPYAVYTITPNINLSISIPSNFELNLFDNRTENNNSYSINQDNFNNYNTTGTDSTFGTNTFRYQSVVITENSNITSLKIGYYQTTTTAVKIALFITNAKYDNINNRYIPNSNLSNLSQYVTIPTTTTVGHKILTLTSFNLPIFNDLTEGNTFFLKIFTYGGSPRLQFNSTINNCLNYVKLFTTGAIEQFDTNNYDLMINYTLNRIAHNNELLNSSNALVNNLELLTLNSTSGNSILLNSSINGTNTNFQFFNTQNLQLKRLKIGGYISFLDNFEFLFESNITNFNLNSTYTIIIFRLEIYLNEKSGYYNNFWDSQIVLSFSINSVNATISLHENDFYYEI